MRDYCGERVADRVLSILPPEAAVEVNGAIPSGWCSFQSLLLLDAAISEVCGRDARQTYRDLGLLEWESTPAEHPATARHTDRATNVMSVSDACGPR